MRKIMSWLLVLPLVLLMIATTATPSMARPIIKVSECRIDFNATVYWTGDSENLWEQVVALHNSLPSKCWDRCVFTNIDLGYWLRLMNRRFVSETVVPDALFDEMQKCYIEVNPAESLASGSSGSGVICTTGNSFTLHVSGSGNSVSANQRGCSSVTITIHGNYAVVHINQIGKNDANLVLHGDNISVSLHQQGAHSYTGHFTSGQTATITQIGNDD